MTLRQYMTETLHSTCKAVGQYIQVTHAPPCVSSLLGWFGFSHKKPKVVPGKADAAAQTQFIADWQTLKAISVTVN
jgi:hypothetical protein